MPEMSEDQTQEITTHTIEQTEEITTNVPEITTITTSSKLAEDTDENTLRPIVSLSSSTSNSLEMTTNLMESSNSSSTNSSESSTSQSLETTTISNSSEAFTSNFIETTSNGSEMSTSHSTERALNFSENSTPSSTEMFTSNLLENPPSKSVESTTSNSSSDSTESSTSNSSEATTSNLEMESSTSNLSESSTILIESSNSNSSNASDLLESSTNLIEILHSSTSEASTFNFIDSATETSIDKIVNAPTNHATETITDAPTTESLTENPTENAQNEETTTLTTTNASDEPKGRALNFSVEEESSSNVLPNISHHHDYTYLSDESVHDDDDDDNFNIDVDSLDSKILAPKNHIHNSSLSVCEKGGLTYENGEKLELGCESVCTCRDGKMDCTDRCAGPYFRRGKKIDDPLCTAKEVEDPCCSILVCAGDTETEPLEYCTYENQTYNRGESFNKTCTEICTCEIAGKISCKPRCPRITKTSDRCVEVPDPDDYCCLKLLCDVTLDEHDTEKEEEKSKPKLLSAKYINSTAILLTFDSVTKFDEENMPIVEATSDKHIWMYYKLSPGDVVLVKDKVRYLKIENSSDVVEVENSELASDSLSGINFPSESDLALQLGTSHDLESSLESIDSRTCNYKGKMFEHGEEYNDECVSLCVCQKGEMKCLKLQCPTYFGVDVIDPNCIEWETMPRDFVPSPPNCCPEKVQCKNNGSCEYEGQMYKNWDLISSNVTGCEKKCYCEMGKVECQNICPPVTALPPPHLNCPPHLAMVGHIPEDDCCKYWICQTENHLPEVQRNETESDTKGHTRQNSTDSYMGPFAPKVPSKVLGPLAVYENEDNEQTVVNNSLGTPFKPTVSPYENPFYNKKPPPQKLLDSQANKPKNKDPPYLGPFNPNIGKINSKPSKNKMGIKDHSLPPPPPHTYQKHEHFVPNYYNPPPDLRFQNPPSHVNIHSHGSPEEILQFIHQHPEISNYPSGSVLEIHNVDPNGNIREPFGSQGMQSVNKPKIHLVPYIVPQNGEGQPIHDNLPPGLSLEEILQEFQKNSQTLQNNPLAFHPPPQNAGKNGPVLQQPNGLLVHNRHNATNTGNDEQLLPDSFPGLPSQHPQEEIVIQSLEAVDPHKVRLAFTVPPIIVGLHGRFEVRYTHNKDEKDLDSWMLTVFAPPNDLIATPSLEFDLTDLKADTEYSIKITVTLRDLHNMPTSKIYHIKTPEEVHPPIIPINPELAIADINATWVTVVWRAFTQYELQFIDGIQLRYKEIDGRIYTATPLIHRAVTRHTLEKLKPNTKYEIGIYFIPFPGQMTELKAENILHFTTANEIDTYGFNVSLEISQIKSQSVEISWNGVPYPEDKYVNIYRAIYQSDSGKEDHSTFKIAKRDSPTKTIIRDLKPGTRYRLWLEVYLTNGKIKTSNVEDFITKPRAAPALGSTTQQDKLSRAEVLEPKGDYYGPLVIVAILAAIAILSTLILLLILVRRHNQNKAAITPPSTRISQSAYDNPTYKVEIQQETMGL